MTEKQGPGGEEQSQLPNSPLLNVSFCPQCQHVKFLGSVLWDLYQQLPTFSGLGLRLSHGVSSPTNKLNCLTRFSDSPTCETSSLS